MWPRTTSPAPQSARPSRKAARPGSGRRASRAIGDDRLSSTDRDLAGLPAACLIVCEQDPLGDQDLAYGLRLVAARLHTELHLVPGAFQLFESFAPAGHLARRTTETWTQALAAGLRA
jgi:acetyl esterase/lipase